MTNEVAHELNETDPKALAQISEIIEKIGEERVKLIVVAAKILYDVGGLVRMSDYLDNRYNFHRRGKRKRDQGPRTLGGVFFFLVSLHPEGIKFMKKKIPPVGAAT